MIVLSGPGARSRQLQIPRGFPVWLCLLSLLSVSASLFAGRQARAWFDPHAHRPGVAAAPVKPLLLPAMREVQIEPPKPRRKRVRHEPVQPLEAEEVVDPLHNVSQRDRAAESPLPAELSLFDVNAAQAIRLRPFDSQGLPERNAFDQLKEFMRCRRTGKAHDMNPSLVALLSSIAAHFEGATLHVISGHRAADDVTTRPSSQHTRGTAADIRIPGVSIEKLAAAAHELGAKGVGVYPLSRFVHVDVRDQPYYWRDVGTGPVATRAPF